MALHPALQLRVPQPGLHVASGPSVQGPLLAWGRAGARRAGRGTSCLAPEGEVTPAVMSLSLSQPLRDSSGHDAFPPVPVIHLHSGHHRIAPGIPSAGR